MSIFDKLIARCEFFCTANRCTNKYANIKTKHFVWHQTLLSMVYQAIHSISSQLITFLDNISLICWLFGFIRFSLLEFGYNFFCRHFFITPVFLLLRTFCIKSIFRDLIGFPKPINAEVLPAFLSICLFALTECTRLQYVLKASSERFFRCSSINSLVSSQFRDETFFSGLPPS